MSILFLKICYLCLGGAANTPFCSGIDLYLLLPLNPKDQPNAQTLTDYGGGRGGDWIGGVL
jgi:hypothetical protein